VKAGEPTARMARAGVRGKGRVKRLKEEKRQPPEPRSWGSAMPGNPNPEPQVPVKLTQPQRKVVAQIAPGLADRLKLGEKPQRTIPFSLADLKAIKEKARGALRQGGTGRSRVPLRYASRRAPRPSTNTRAPLHLRKGA